MTLPELSIQRHVLAWMLSGILVLFGFVAYNRIGVDRFPDIDFPMVSVTTVLKGAQPDVMDASITSLIEEKVNSVPGIEHVISKSSPGVSIVNVQFELKKNIDVAFNEVQAKVNQVLRQLPDGVDPPVVAKVEVGAAPVMWLALTGNRTLQQLNQYARNVIKKRLENIEGVGEIRIGGERQRTIRVWLDPERMHALNIAVPDVIQAFKREHVQFPGGFLVSGRREYLIRLDMEFHHVRELRHMVVAAHKNGRVQLDDIARIEDGLADYRQLSRFNGHPAVGLGIVRVTGANTVAIAREVKRRLAQDILPVLPPGMHLDIATNDAEIIEEIVDGLKEHLYESVFLAALIVLVFLKNVRATAMISLAIPVSLLAAIAAAFFLHYTLNLMTLLALLLLIGVVVDDAIVVLENIYRHREKGLEPDAREAAVKGSRQVAFAVIAASLTLVAIFAPVIFLGGLVGRFFQAFAIVVVFGVLASMLVALTLTPMLCSRYLRVEKKHGILYSFFDHAFLTLDQGYKRILAWVLKWRWTVLASAAIIFVASLWLFSVVGKGFVPQEDENRFMVIFKSPLGASIEDTRRKIGIMEGILRSNPVVANIFTTVGLGAAGQVNQGVAFVHLTPKSTRTIRQWDIISGVQEELSEIPGLHVFVVRVPIIGGQRGEPLQFGLTGPNLDKAAQLSHALLERLNNIPGIGHVDLDMQLNLPELTLQLGRIRARDLGITAADAALAVNVLAGGLDVAKYNDIPGDGNRYDIRLKANSGELKHPDDMSKIYVRASSGELIRLDTVAHWKKGLGPAVIPRMDLRYSGMFYSRPVMPLGNAVEIVRQQAKDILPPAYGITFLGQASEFGKTLKNIVFAFSMAMILVYMVLASQFNSFLQPWVLMLAQPLAVIGGVAALWMSGNTLNIFSMIGLVLLIGLVAKNSILLVDFTNQLRARGASIDEALQNACPIRMRPVLMTSLTIIFALLPTALGLGRGSEMTIPMAVAVVGGMISSTLLTLIVVPAAYSLLEHGVLNVKNRWRQAHRMR